MQHLAGQRRSAVAVRRIGGPHRGAGELREPLRAGGVVGVAVRDQDQFDGAKAGEFLQVVLIQRTGIHHHDAGRPPGPRARTNSFRAG